MYREAFPDISFEIGLQVAEGDYVATRWTGTGTHNGPIMGIEPTGNSSTVTGIGIDRIEDGKVVESWNSWDTLGMMQSIGAIPQAGGPRAGLGARRRRRRPCRSRGARGWRGVPSCRS